MNGSPVNYEKVRQAFNALACDVINHGYGVGISGLNLEMHHNGIMITVNVPQGSDRLEVKLQVEESFIDVRTQLASGNALVKLLDKHQPSIESTLRL